MTVNAISLYEPWATAMRLWLKRNETRSFEPYSRLMNKPLLICAAKKDTGELRAIASELLPVGEGLHHGKAVALVRLVDVQTSTEFALFSKRQSTEQELKWGDYSPGRYAWITEPISLDFNPFPVIGRQGVFKVEFPYAL